MLRDAVSGPATNPFYHERPSAPPSPCENHSDARHCRLVLPPQGLRHLPEDGRTAGLIGDYGQGNRFGESEQVGRGGGTQTHRALYAARCQQGNQADRDRPPEEPAHGRAVAGDHHRPDGQLAGSDDPPTQDPLRRVPCGDVRGGPEREISKRPTSAGWYSRRHHHPIDTGRSP